jgi:hypothetical protein
MSFLKPVQKSIRGKRMRLTQNYMPANFASQAPLSLPNGLFFAKWDKLSAVFGEEFIHAGGFMLSEQDLLLEDVYPAERSKANVMLSPLKVDYSSLVFSEALLEDPLPLRPRKSQGPRARGRIG